MAIATADGFQEYQTRSTAGYENMAWKDSGDAVMYADGALVQVGRRRYANCRAMFMTPGCAWPTSTTS